MPLPIIHTVFYDESLTGLATFQIFDLLVLYICFIFANKMIALWKQQYKRKPQCSV